MRRSLDFLKRFSALFMALLMLVIVFTSCKKETEEGISGEVVSENVSLNLGEGEPVPTLNDLQIKIQEAKKTNPKVYAWLVVPGLNISEPIVYDQENSNKYWETRNLSGEEVANGLADVTWASAYDTFGDNASGDGKNNVIFGHNWNNIYAPYVIGPNPEYKSFAQLLSFADIDFSGSHQYIYLATEKTMRVYKVFSAMNSESDWTSELGFNYINTDPSKDNFATMIDEMKKRSFINFDTEVTTEDNILTLSTCTRYESSGGSDQRFVVVARLVKDGESQSDMASVSVNNERKEPSF